MARPPKSPSDTAAAAQAKGQDGRDRHADAHWQGDMDNLEDVANALAALEARVAALESA